MAQQAAPLEFKSLKRKPATIEKHGHSFYVCDETAIAIRRRAGFPETVKGAIKLKGAFVSFPAAVAFLRRCAELGEVTQLAFTKKVDTMAAYLGVSSEALLASVPTIGALQTTAFGGAFSVHDFLESGKPPLGYIAEDKYRTPAQDEQDVDDHESVRETKRKFVAYDDEGIERGQVSSLLEAIGTPVADEATRGWLLTHFNGRWTVAGFVPTATDVAFIGGANEAALGASSRTKLVPRKEVEAAAAAPPEQASLKAAPSAPPATAPPSGQAADPRQLATKQSKKSKAAAKAPAPDAESAGQTTSLAEAESGVVAKRARKAKAA